MRGTRRSFLHATVGAGLLPGELARLFKFHVDQDQAQVPASLVKLRPEIKPLIKLLDDTPREKCPEVIVEQLQKGVPYRELMAAAFLFAVTRGGHHSVYLIHAAHQMSLEVGPEDRLLPLFWSVDIIKEHLTRFNKTELPPLTGKLPTPEKAVHEFEAAMANWEQERAERTIIALSRSFGSQQTMARLWKYAARDWSFIGHLPISVAHCQRTLHTIGWQHAEPVLRFVIQDLHRWSPSNTEGQPYARSQAHVERTFERLRPDWAGGNSDVEATSELLQIIRSGRVNAAGDWTAQQLSEGRIQSGTVWDAVFLAAAEFMVRFKLGQIRISNRALHSNTSMNSLHYSFRVCQDSRTRYLILLQAVGWMTGFIQNEDRRGMLRDLTITEIPDVEIPGTETETVEAIFEMLPERKFRTEINDRTGQDLACRLTFALASNQPTATLFLKTARQMICHKSTGNAHDFKFPIAVLENMQWISPQWRPHLLASMVHFLSGTSNTDHEAVARGMDALKHFAN